MLHYLFRVSHLHLSHTSIGNIWTSRQETLIALLEDLNLGLFFLYPQQTSIKRFILTISNITQQKSADTARMRTHYFITIVGAQWDERQRKEGERSCDHFTLTHQHFHSTTLFQPDWRKLCKADGEWCAPNAGDWVSSAVWRTLQLRKQVWQIVPYKRNRCISVFVGNHERRERNCKMYAISYNVLFTFMHLSDAFIQSDLQCIQVIHFLSVHVFPGNRTHNLCAANAMLYPLSHRNTI